MTSLCTKAQVEIGLPFLELRREILKVECHGDVIAHTSHIPATPARHPGANHRSLFTCVLPFMPFPIFGVSCRRGCHDRAPGSQVADQLQSRSLGRDRG